MFAIPSLTSLELFTLLAACVAWPHPIQVLDWLHDAWLWSLGPR